MTLCLTLHELWHSCRAGVTERDIHPRALFARLQLTGCVDYAAYRAALADALDPANSYFAKRFPLLLLGLESFQ